MLPSTRKHISRSMIADTLRSYSSDTSPEREPSKSPKQCKGPERLINTIETDTESSNSTPSVVDDVANERHNESSAILALSSVNPRYPAYYQASLDVPQLSTIPEMPDSPPWRRTPSRRRPAGLGSGPHKHPAEDSFELRSPTSIYSRDTDDPFLSQDSYMPPSSLKIELERDGATRINPQIQPKSPFVTVLNDPRAQEFSFMQSTGNGWTADLDQFVYSKHEVGPSRSHTIIPEYGSILDHAKASRRQKQHVRQRSSVEAELEAIGYEKVHAAIEKQQRSGRIDYEKSLPSPPVETFSPEIRARLGLTSTTDRSSPQRSEMVPSPNTSPYRLKPQALQLNEWLVQAKDPVERDADGLGFRRLSQSPERSPSRLQRLKSRLSRSPERPVRMEPKRRSPDLAVAHHTTVGSTIGAESRGRTRFRSPDTLFDASPIRSHEQIGYQHQALNHKEDIAHKFAVSRVADRSTTLPVFPTESMPRASTEKLWGDKGVLSRPVQSPAQSATPRGKKTPLKQMASRLFKGLETSPSFAKTVSPSSPESVSKEKSLLSKFPISIERGDQMRLFGEVEYMLQTLANDFLLEQMEHSRLSRKSVKDTVDKWARRGKAQVVDFCFDLRTQLELLQQNMDRVQFHGRDAFDNKRRFVLIYAWKDVARELAVRSFCSADSAVKKMLSDCYVILDMLGAEGAYWLVFQKLHVTTLDKIRVAEDERMKSRDLMPGQTRQVIPGSPLRDEDMEGQMMTNRHLFESL